MKTVCITQLDDGTFTVELENEMSETQDMAMEGADPMEGTEADYTEDAAEGETEQGYATVDDALAAAAAMFDAPVEEPMMEGEAEFRAGFDGMRGGM